MTAGQRNCYFVIEECVRRYSLENVQFAVEEVRKTLRKEQVAARVARRTAREAIEAHEKGTER